MKKVNTAAAKPPGINVPESPQERFQDSQGVIAQNATEMPSEARQVIVKAMSKWEWPGEVKESMKRVEINSGIRAWMEYDLEFANWLRTCIIQHVVSRFKDQSLCYIPNNWHDDIGKVITIETGQDGVYHVMA